jgi:2-polyprenyl-3-methyl-5-hydroxy-6-metoxy-1,4-benzoquinol methylase
MADRKEYWETRLQENSGLQGVGHIRQSQSWNTAMYRVKKRVLRRVLRSTGVDLRTARALDIGSGTGFVVDVLYAEGARCVTGVDITDHAVGLLRARHPQGQFFQLDVGEPNATVPGAPFDVVTANEVLFHIVDDERYDNAIRNIHDMLLPGGFFVFSDNFVRHGELRTPHQASRSSERIHAAVRAAGLRVVRRVPMFLLMGYPVDSSSTKHQDRWRGTIGRAARSERWGPVLGAALTPLELIATRLFREGPTVEFMLCQRPAESPLAD